MQCASKLAAGETVMGMMHFTASPMIVEVMASAGLDFSIIDLEHSPIDLAHGRAPRARRRRGGHRAVAAHARSRRRVWSRKC